MVSKLLIDLRKALGERWNLVMLASFWNDIWVGVTPIRVYFYILYPISNKKGKASEFGSWKYRNMVYNV